ncbi:MAG: GNAT family N-acetyltransferase, partial [Chloroflexi bacterium]|nr:GNAT family N-acetyltransferase [Chloroflexota bacterium]
WYVDPEWRKQGVGRLLVVAAEAWALEQGCTEMASDTNADYPLSPTAHARLGYQEVRRDIFFRKVLTPE